MHISEGILPLSWASLWWGLTGGVLAFTFPKIKTKFQTQEGKALFALITALIFLFSSIPIPVPFTGTCSHPVGVSLAVFTLGLGSAIYSGFIVLLLQALFLAHGGLSTLGANAFSMAIIGSLSVYLILKVLKNFNLPLYIKGFLGGIFSDWATYLTTAFQLALSLRGDESFSSLFLKALLAFVPLQVPLGIIEGILAGAFLMAVAKKRRDLLVLVTEPPLPEKPELVPKETKE